MSDDTVYPDAFAVVAGLERTANDLLELAQESGAAAEDLKNAILSGGHKAEALDSLHKQLELLTGDVERMRAALRREETPHAH